MSDEDIERLELLTRPSDGLLLVRRGVEDLVATDEADCLFESGLSHWRRHECAEAVRCFARCLQHNPNHAASQFYIGLAYYQGDGVPDKDYGQAAISWRKAALQGNAEAQNNLARAYERGHGLPRDDEKAAYWFSRAAEHGDPTAQFNLAVMYELAWRSRRPGYGRRLVPEGRRARIRCCSIEPWWHVPTRTRGSARFCQSGFLVSESL